MAGNKFNTSFKEWRVKDLKLTYVGNYGDTITFEGNIDQMVRHLMNLREVR